MVTIQKPKGKLRELETERYILSTLPVLWLPLYRKDGSSLISADGIGHVCTPTGTTWGIQGRIFDALDDRISIPAHASINNLTEFTFWCWMKLTAFDTGNVIFDKNLKLLSYSTATALDSRVYYSTTNARSVTTTAPAADIATFVVMTYSESGDRKIHIYFNLAEAGYSIQTASVGTISNENANLTVFGQGANNGLDGLGAEVGVHNKALTAVEMQHIYQATKWRY